ncbi:MAG: hypothetical protein Ct9H300mP28_29460 [Pseudomonadota bacterium]|nr:MAG: hypothetical protein Ct9H300mP28_29460 [Pseudomonadota bacterium]
MYRAKIPLDKEGKIIGLRTKTYASLGHIYPISHHVPTYLMAPDAGIIHHTSCSCRCYCFLTHTVLLIPLEEQDVRKHIWHRATVNCSREIGMDLLNSA